MTAAASASAATGAAVAIAPAPARASVEPKAVPLAKANKEHRSSIRSALKRGAEIRRRQEFQQRLVHRDPSSHRVRRRCVVYRSAVPRIRAGHQSRHRSRRTFRQHPRHQRLHRSPPLNRAAVLPTASPTQLRHNEAFDSRARPQSWRNRRPSASFFESAARSATPNFHSSQRANSGEDRTPRPHATKSAKHSERSAVIHAASRNFAHRSHRINEPARRPGYARRAAQPDHAGDFFAKARSTIHGTVRVVVKIRVDKSGAVSSAVPASSPSRFFGDAAVQAAKQWDFTPAKVSGQPVPSEWLVRFRLHLDRHQSSAVANQAAKLIH